MKFINLIKTKSKAIFWSLVVFSFQVRAEIPGTDDFADGAEDKGGIDTLYWIFEKFVQLIILGIAVAFVIVIGKAAIKKYNDISDERGSWMDLMGHVVGGIALLTLCIIMMNWVGTWVD